METLQNRAKTPTVVIRGLTVETIWHHRDETIIEAIDDTLPKRVVQTAKPHRFHPDAIWRHMALKNPRYREAYVRFVEDVKAGHIPLPDAERDMILRLDIKDVFARGDEEQEPHTFISAREGYAAANGLALHDVHPGTGATEEEYKPYLQSIREYFGIMNDIRLNDVPYEEQFCQQWNNRRMLFASCRFGETASHLIGRCKMIHRCNWCECGPLARRTPGTGCRLAFDCCPNRGLGNTYKEMSTCAVANRPRWDQSVCPGAFLGHIELLAKRFGEDSGYFIPMCSWWEPGDTWSNEAGRRKRARPRKNQAIQ